MMIPKWSISLSMILNQIGKNFSVIIGKLWLKMGYFRSKGKNKCKFEADSWIIYEK